MTSDPTILVREVVKTYGAAASRVEALRGVSLDIARGERVAILGRSGSGKSTLLNLLGCLDRPTAGTISVGGRELGSLTSRERAAYRLKTAGMIFQAYHLVGTRTALGNVELPLVLAGHSRRERRAKARDALEAVGLADRCEHLPSRLSGGEQQRVAIARALVNEPSLLLADEPTGNLDTATADAVMSLLVERTRVLGTTVLLVTHDEALAARVADRLLRMSDGRLEG
ncbi:MAG: ABC transporter ATP-binding protein [Planctomycetes bacterium]|nr:ABC transporter ATP-binding protein [Planctomycetota bacterium]